MARLTEQGAIDLLRGTKGVDYDDLDDIFTVFGFSSEFAAPDVTWYWHKTYDCGQFRARPLHDFSVLSAAQRAIVLRMVMCVVSKRSVEEE